MLPTRARFSKLTLDDLLNNVLLTLLLASYVALVYALVILLLLVMRWLPSGNVQIVFAPPWWVSILTIAVISPTLPPLYRWLNSHISDIIYGQHDDPYTLLSAINMQLRVMNSPQITLPAVAESIARAFKLPYVAIITSITNQPLRCTFGTAPPQSVTTTLPLRYLELPLGELVVANRSNAPLSGPDWALLDDVARQIGIALHVVQLAADLQASRERLVISREEERRRIRNDLHDGLGPTLSALQLQLGAVRKLIHQKPDEAEALIVEWRDVLRQATTEIRQLVYDLRPPLLDELGLVEAIRGLQRHESTLVLEVVAPDPMPKLSAALEVALYRIASEAVHNVVRHAQATRCVVQLQIEPDTLTMTIRDNGCGFSPAAAAGVGFISMRERAAELGGTLTILPAPPGAAEGVEVTVRFPYAH